jgi:hypothetical protein
MSVAMDTHATIEELLDVVFSADPFPGFIHGDSGGVTATYGSHF